MISRNVDTGCSKMIVKEIAYSHNHVEKFVWLTQGNITKSLNINIAIALHFTIIIR